MKKLNILLCSGGNDSLYIFHKFNKKKFKTIYFNYGQKYMEEEVKRIPAGTEIINIPELVVTEKGFFLGRNLTFLIEIAKRYSEGTIWFGSQSEDIFPDNNIKFFKKAIKVVNASFGTNLKIKIPLRKLTKKEIMDYITSNNINTYSCYVGGEIPCGECKACKSILNKE